MNTTIEFDGEYIIKLVGATMTAKFAFDNREGLLITSCFGSDKIAYKSVSLDSLSYAVDFGMLATRLASELPEEFEDGIEMIQHWIKFHMKFASLQRQYVWLYESTIASDRA